MKKFLSFILFCLFGCMMVFVSCSKDTEGGESNKPFSKAVEMVLHAVADEAKDIVQSRGLIKYSEFDLNYDPTSVFLHIAGSDATIEIPLFTKTCSGQVCKCFKYHLEKFEDGSAKVTPYLADGKLASESLTVPAGSKLYFFRNKPHHPSFPPDYPSIPIRPVRWMMWFITKEIQKRIRKSIEV